MIKAQNSGIMRALKWKLIRVYSFVATKNSSNLDSSCDMLARTLTLEPENSTESQLCHSLRVRMDKPSNFRFLTGLSWESEDVCVWMYFTRFQAWCKHERWLITFIPTRILTVTPKQREPAQEAECWNVFYMSSCLCHGDAAWLEQRKCSDFSNTDSFHTFKCQK